MSNEKSILPEDNNKIKNFLTVKNSLISYYQNITSAQAVRLIGFTAGIFTLIGITQLHPEEHLGEFFSEAAILPLSNGVPTAISSSINFLFLAGSILFLSFFIVRAIFRYAAYANFADALIYVSLEETESVNGKSLHGQLVNALIAHIQKYPRNVLNMPISYFISYSGNKEYSKGFWRCVCLSLLSTFLILLLIW